MNNLQKDIAQRIIDKLEKIKEDPFRYLEHFEGEGYKLRIGDYRMLIDVNQKNKMLTIQVFDKRGRIYK
ncbi:MAG: hypothetical protein AABX16_02560 [Nanoarchaeota archaeon]